jgi:hypothetical protein
MGCGMGSLRCCRSRSGYRHPGRGPIGDRAPTAGIVYVCATGGLVLDCCAADGSHTRALKRTYRSP